MIYKILSRGFGKNVYYKSEFIDTKKNKIFEGCKTPIDVKVAYELYLCMRKERVLIDKVVRVNIKSRGHNLGIKIMR
jgi:hypothetical protein